MDKLKETLGPVYKHGFWVACGVIVVLALGIWFISTLGLRNTTEANAEAINAAFSTVESVNSATVDAAGEGNDPTQVHFHPNDVSARETERLNSRLKAEVADAWERQYNFQRDLFVWPAKVAKRDGADTPFQKAIDETLESPRWKFELDDGQIIVDVRSKEEAIQQVASQRGLDPEEIEKSAKAEYVPYQLPIEVAVPFNPSESPPTPVEAEISDSFRRIYRDFIKSHVPTLAEVIGSNWNPSARTGTNSGAGEGVAGIPRSSGASATRGVDNPEQEDEIVTWNGSNQGHWLEKLSAFADRAEQDYVPTTLQMLYTQEDLWVLEALLNVIKQTNGDVSLKHEAAIKEIDFLLTGKAAGEMPGSITPIGSPSAEGGSDGSGDPYGGGDGYSSSNPYGQGDPYSQGGGTDGYSSESGGQGQTMVADPANDRYVDRDYRMIPGSKLREVFAQEPTPENAYLRVAKRIPVRMGLQMDVRKLARLLVACSNSPLIIEVRQVRVNRHSPRDGTSGAGGGQAGAYGGVNRGGTQELGNYGAAGAGYGAQGKSSSTTTAESHVAPVEIYGVVLIYNPVDAKTLEVKPGEGDEDAAEDEDAETDVVSESSA